MSDEPLDFTIEQQLRVSVRSISDAVAGAAGAFYIDPDKAEQFIAEVTACADMLDDAIRAAQTAGTIRPPGGDLVSENAVKQAIQMAHNAEVAVTTYQRQLLETGAALRDQLAAYRATEQANTPGPG